MSRPSVVEVPAISLATCAQMVEEITRVLEGVESVLELQIMSSTQGRADDALDLMSRTLREQVTRLEQVQAALDAHASCGVAPPIAGEARAVRRIESGGDVGSDPKTE